MPQPRSCGLCDESWRRGRGTQVHGMTRNGTASRSQASPEPVALVASAPSKASRSRTILLQARREASEQALRRALRVSAPLESLEMKPIRSRLPFPVWEHLVKQVLSTFKERLRLPVWKRPERPEPSPPLSSQSSSSTTRTKATKSVRKIGKKTKRSAKGASKS